MALNAAHNGYKEVAIPFYIDKDNILDGDEDAQVLVLEDGVITDYALKLYKWIVFSISPLTALSKMKLQTLRAHWQHQKQHRKLWTIQPAEIHAKGLLMKQAWK